MFNPIFGSQEPRALGDANDQKMEMKCLDQSTM
jgi:hypothetical protein